MESEVWKAFGAARAASVVFIGLGLGHGGSAGLDPQDLTHDSGDLQNKIVSSLNWAFLSPDVHFCTCVRMLRVHRNDMKQNRNARRPQPHIALHTACLAAPIRLHRLFARDVQGRAPKRPHEQRDPTNHGVWNPPCLGHWNHNVGSVCLCVLWVL